MSNLSRWAREVFTQERACQQAASRGEPQTDACKQNAEDVKSAVVELRDQHNEGGYREPEGQGE